MDGYSPLSVNRLGEEKKGEKGRKITESMFITIEISVIDRSISSLEGAEDHLDQTTCDTFTEKETTTNGPKLSCYANCNFFYYA